MRRLLKRVADCIHRDIGPRSLSNIAWSMSTLLLRDAAMWEELAVVSLPLIVEFNAV